MPIPRMSIMSVLTSSLLLLLFVQLAATPAWAAEPQKDGAGLSDPQQAQRDREWLTGYMIAHQGYRLHHLDALNDQFSKMTPTQLSTLRMFHEQKHEHTMRQNELEQRMREQQVSMAEAHNRQAQQTMRDFNRQQSEGAMGEQHRLDSLHREAFQNHQMMQREAVNSHYRSGIFGGYGWGGGRVLPY